MCLQSSPPVKCGQVQDASSCGCPLALRSSSTRYGRAWLPGVYKRVYIEQFVSEVLQK